MTFFRGVPFYLTLVVTCVVMSQAFDTLTLSDCLLLSVLWVLLDIDRHVDP